MALTYNFSLKQTLEARGVPASDDNFLGLLRANFPNFDLNWGPGTATGNINAWWVREGLSIASGATQALDLRALAVGPDEGATVLLAEVRGIFIRARDTNTTTVTFDPAASNGWTALGAAFALPLEPGTVWQLWNPVDGAWPTTASDKAVDLINSAGAAAVVDILFVGVAS
jgi:hypothetical protein